MMITTSADLSELVARACKTDAVALDTEFVWERTYYPQLGLIQMALSDEDCILIDPIAIEDLSPLGELLSDRSVVKVLHDAPQDLAILSRVTGAVPQNIFDTKIAAGFANLPSTMSLCKLIKELLDIELPKTETRTNWLKRPLDEKQVLYALDDVRYLRAVRVLLLNRVIGPQIKSWLQEELNILNNPKHYQENCNGDRFRKIRGCGSLKRDSLAILKELVIWREGEAKKQDKPRGHIIKDNILLNIANEKTLQIENLQQKTGISAKAHKKYGSVIIELTQQVLNTPEENYPTVKRVTRLSQKDKLTLDKLHGLIKLKCELLGIDPALVGNSGELKSLAKVLTSSRSQQLPDLRQTEGWRRSLLQDFFHQHH